MGTRLLFANNARGTLAAGLSSSATSVTLGSGEGARFGSSPQPNEFLRGTLRNAAGTAIELVSITAISGDVLTIVRGQESTAGQAFAAGDTLSVRLTRESMTRQAQKDADEIITGTWSFPTPTLGASPVPKSYVDAQVSAVASRSRNRFVNSSMREDQRREGVALGVVQTSGTQAFPLAYLCDQWFFYAQATSSGSGTINGQRVLTHEPFPAVSRITVSSATVPFDLYFGQRLEHAAVVDLAGSSVTIGFDLSLSAGSSVQWFAYRPTTNPAYRGTTASSCFGTSTSPTKTLISSGTWTGISSTLSRRTATFAVPSGVAGGIGGIEILLKVPAAAASTVWEIAGSAQLEKGVTATPYLMPSPSEEQLGCRAFFWKTYDAGVKPGATNTNGYLTARAVTTSLTCLELSTSLPVDMFKTPTVQFFNPITGVSDEIRTSGGTGIAVTGVNITGTRVVGAPTLGAAPTVGLGLYAHITCEAVIP